MARTATSYLKRMLLIVSFLILMGLLLESAGIFSWVATESYSRGTGLPVETHRGAKEVWIEVHDVSRGYGAKPLLEVVDVLDRHPNAYTRAVILVIPNHGGGSPLRNYPEFTEVLGELEKRGYTLGVHGYAHPVPLRGREFMVSGASAVSLVSTALDEFDSAGLGRPSIFAPPGWGASTEVAGVLIRNFRYVYYYYYVGTENAVLPHPVHEYTWYRLNPGLWKAKLDYRRTRGVFRLSVHLGAANSKENLKFIDDFLAYVEDER
ncbi:MAG: DUF2334 domain-containing protein [Candidatus Hydrothermarchaeaceae archaeon]